jgi:hypothetical protein
MGNWDSSKKIIILIILFSFFPFIIKSQTVEEIITNLDFFKSINSISLTMTAQSITYDINGNTLVNNTAVNINYHIQKPDYLKLTKQIGNNNYEQIRENNREIIKINGEEIKNTEVKGINDLLPEPQMIFNLTEYLAGFEISKEGENKITGVLQENKEQKRIEIEFNSDEIESIIIYGVQGKKETEIKINEYSEINGKKIPVNIKKIIYSNKTRVEKNITYTITGVE